MSSHRPATPEEREQARLRAAKWRADNREKHRRYTREYWAVRRPEKNEKNKKWNKANPERARLHQKNYRERHPQKCAASAVNWRNSNPGARPAACQRYRARKSSAVGDYTATEWQQLVADTGNVCLCCGVSGLNVTLTPDHVVPLSRGGSNFISNIQPLCGLCNSKKGTKIIRYPISE